ncbi:MAG: c-type cytochrome [Planctomycetia bacterium]|nr:c-type cytochrome [Planctomycetia bacterium]
MTRRVVLLCAFSYLTANCALAQPKAPETPASADKRLVVELFAAAPDIVHPIATDFDSKGRLLVVESHTHFRPAKYDGPKADRIRVLADTDGDGKADKFTTFFEGTTHTMDLAVHLDGSVFVATRNEILRLRDTDNDGKADEKTRLVFLDTKGNYPHNGLCGLSFDFRGDLYFGMGENLGEPYKLIGSDNTTLTGGGEGGNFYHCTADGKKLRRVATGFWNPFGSGRDIFGRLFVVDNDPDASPPCRLLHVVEGGDYGFQFRYGRAGRHPFQAWNGELPGTLPMVAGTGESPCEVISYESDGLPDEYRGELLVPAWADHRVERYTLKPKGASFTAERKPFIQGGKDFYPSGMTVAPDGSLFVTDWGSRSYELHGKGAVWHVKWKDAKPAKRPKQAKEAILSKDRKTRENAARELAKTEAGCAVLREQLKSKDVRVQATVLDALVTVRDAGVLLTDVARTDPNDYIRGVAVRGLIARGDSVFEFISDKQPLPVFVEAFSTASFDQIRRFTPDYARTNDSFLRHLWITTLSRSSNALAVFDRIDVKDRNYRLDRLLAWRASGEEARTKRLPGFLKDTDPDVRLLAAKWVSDEKLIEFRPQIVEMLKSNTLDPREFIALTTTLARLDGKPVNENSLAAYFLERLTDKNATIPLRVMALRAIPASYGKLRTETLLELLKQDDAALKVEVLRTLKDRADVKAAPAVRNIARNAKQPVAVRAQALVTLSALGSADADFLLELVGGTEVILRHEALRTLVQVKLTPAQLEKLTEAVKGKDDSGDLAKRVLGKPVNAGRPAATEIDAWMKLLEGKADAETGRRIFENSRVTTCARCHRVDGRGANVGPDLSLIGRTEKKWIVESLLLPSATIAPHFQAWTIRTTDDRTLTGILVRTYLDESEYIDEKGNHFKVLATDVADMRPAKNSIMPEGLLNALTDQEIRDLVAYLASRK